jgi:hypothetical protein
MSVATYPTAHCSGTATYPTTYPPGVLTGRPMEMFEVAPTLDLYATPEQWVVGDGDVAILEELTDALRERDLERDWAMLEIQDLLVGLESIPDGEWIESRDRGNHSWSATPTIAASALDQFEEDSDYEEFIWMNKVDMEMEEVLDEIDLEKQEKMDWIEQQLQHLERFQDKTAYYMYPMVWDGGVIVLHDLFSSFGIKEALQQFEEDFDYEESLVQEQLKNTEVNLHRLLATPPSDRPGWCGTSGYDSGSRGYHELLLKERYRFEAKVVHDFPSSRQGYALCETVYGKIYIPEKFRGFVPPVGESIEVTVALQDVSPKANGKTNSFRFTAIYIH